MDFVTRQFINLTKKLRKELRKTLGLLHTDVQKLTETIKETNKTDSQRQSTPPILRAELQIPPTPITCSEAPDAKKDRRERIKLWIEVATLLAVGVYAYVAVLQWREMVRATGAAERTVNEARRNRIQSEKSLDATIAQFHLDQRAWVGPTDITLNEMHAPNPISAKVSITNSGKTAALRARVTYILHPSDVPLNIEEYAKHPVEGEPKVRPPFTLFPNATMVLLPSTGSTDDLGIRGVNDGRKLLYLFGRIEYHDVFNTVHETRFCVRYHSEAKAFGACESYNYAD
jgi:hypothetical protein